MFKSKRFVIEAYNYYIKDWAQMAENFGESAIITARIEKLEKYRNLYICGMISEREALKIAIEA